MTNKQFRSLGLILNVSVPETVEEFDKLAGKEGAALGLAIDQHIAHSLLTDFRDVLLHGRKHVPATGDKPEVTEIKGVEELTGIERETKPVMGKDGKPTMKDGEPVTEYTESEKKYFDRVLASLVASGKFTDEEQAAASFQSLANEVVAAVPFDPSATERKASGPKKLAAKYKLAAAKSIALGTIAKVNTFLANIKEQFTPSGDTSKLFTGKYPNRNADGTESQVDFSVSDKDAEALGWLLKGYQDWKAQQELNSLTD